MTGGNGQDDKVVEPSAEAASAPQADALRQEVAELKDALLRRAADFENFRKRAERERQLAAGDAAAEIFRELIPVLDNFDRALAAPGGGDALRSGVEMIARQMRAMLESRGIVVEDPLGERFDPRRHEALSHEESARHRDGAVIEVFQKGYALKDRLLRPALVKVAKNHTPSDGRAGEDSLAGRDSRGDIPWGA